MACSQCGGDKRSSLERERERERKAIARQEIARQNAEATKAVLSQRRAENMRQLRDRRQERER